MATLDPGASPGVLSAAVIGAVEHVRWEAIELLSRQKSPYAVDLLRARASELADFAAGRDQISNVVLERAAEDIEHGRAPLGDGAAFYLDQPAGPARRLAVRRGVFTQFQLMEREADDLVVRLEADMGRALTGPRANSGLPNQLLDEARLHKLLWDDPRITATCAHRLIMLCSIPRLIGRARELLSLRLAGCFAPAGSRQPGNEARARPSALPDFNRANRMAARAARAWRW